VLTLEDKLAERAAIREKKSVLQLLLNINECVEKVEELLGIRDTTGAGSRQTAAAAAAAAASSGGSGSGGSTERVASVFNQLQFYVSQARGLPLLNNLQPVLDPVAALKLTTTVTAHCQNHRLAQAEPGGVLPGWHPTKRLEPSNAEPAYVRAHR